MSNDTKNDEFMTADELKKLIETSNCEINLLDLRDDIPTKYTEAMHPYLYAAVYTGENAFTDDVTTHITNHTPSSPKMTFNTRANEGYKAPEPGTNEPKPINAPTLEYNLNQTSNV